MDGVERISQDWIVPMSFDIFIAQLQAKANSDFKVSNIMSRTPAAPREPGDCPQIRKQLQNQHARGL